MNETEELAQPVDTGASERMNDSEIPELPEEPKSVGRPRGLGKVPGSGRKAARETWSPHEIRGELILKSGAIELLCDVASGRPVLVAPPRTAKQTGLSTPLGLCPGAPA